MANFQTADRLSRRQRAAERAAKETNSAHIAAAHIAAAHIAAAHLHQSAADLHRTVAGTGDSDDQITNAEAREATRLAVASSYALVKDEGDLSDVQTSFNSSGADALVYARLAGKPAANGDDHFNRAAARAHEEAARSHYQMAGVTPCHIDALTPL